MTAKSPFDQATNVTAEEGEVVLQGPDGIGLSMTPEAAEETGRRLLDGAGKARDQGEGRARVRSRSTGPSE